MRKMAFALALLSLITAHAAGDYQAGEKKSTACAACHGANGNSTNVAWPNLAGQHPSYFIKALQEIKQGKNQSAVVMAPIAAQLTDQDMADLATYYSQQPLNKGITPKKYLQRGESLYRGGDYAKHITACIACHGPDGQGNAQAGFPVLSGQNAAYTVLQLQAFKNKTRKSDLNEIMRDIAGRMSTEDMEAVAQYISGLH